MEKKFRHRRMAVREELSEDTARKLLYNVKKEIQEQNAEHWIKKQIWKLLPFVLLIIFFLSAIMILATGGR
jgi:hypothetical protein